MPPRSPEITRSWPTSLWRTCPPFTVSSRTQSGPRRPPAWTCRSCWTRESAGDGSCARRGDRLGFHDRCDGGVPRPLLEGVAVAEQLHIRVVVAGQLEADGQPGGTESRRHAEHRKAGG